MRVIIVFSILIVCGFCNLPPVVYIPGSPDVALQINIVGEVQPPAGCPTTGQFIVFGNDTFQGLNNGSCFYYYLSIIYDSKTQTFSNQTNVVRASPPPPPLFFFSFFLFVFFLFFYKKKHLCNNFILFVGNLNCIIESFLFKNQ
eukprot:Phypoly_transcript_17118.p1 GENE.Phypoly_transcript_17118~~Phypoly_transcript_17118.p1  ORF type:complete len:144 (+),score=8.57 Phypoly_transcript_17118:93-524(+)